MQEKRKGIINSDLFIEAVKDSFWKLGPRTQFSNPVMFVTYLGAILVLTTSRKLVITIIPLTLGSL